MSRWTLGEIQDGSGDPRGGPGRVGKPSGWSRAVCWTIGEVWDWSATLGEVRSGLGNPRVGL